MKKSYKELIRLSSFESRLKYLLLHNTSRTDVHNVERYLIQKVYGSREWKRTRDNIIIRDAGRDLGVSGREIFGQIIIHHINPITIDDILLVSESIFSDNNLICTSKNTHTVIHVGDSALIIPIAKERKKGDTNLWKVY